MYTLEFSCPCGYKENVDTRKITCEEQENLIYNKCSEPCPKCNANDTIVWQEVEVLQKTTRRQLFVTLRNMLESPCIDETDEFLDMEITIDDFAKSMAETLKDLIADITNNNRERTKLDV